MDELLELRKDFADEAVEICNRTESVILSISETDHYNSSVEELKKELLGSLHTIKGNSGFIMLDGLHSYVHKTEGLLKEHPVFALSADLKSCFLSLTDCIRNYCSSLMITDVFPADAADHIFSTIERLLTNQNISTAESNDETATAQTEYNTNYKADFDKVTIRYDDLDQLLNLTGEILLSNRSMVQQIKLTAGSTQIDSMVWSTNKKLIALQNKIIETRSLPFSTLTKRYVRLVYDLNSSVNTPVELVVKNEDAPVDKTILEKIHEPLIHLIRNVFAHAVDSAEERKANGKPEKLTITLSCTDGSGSSAIELTDDGKGISVSRIKARALELGISLPEHASDKEILSVIFRPEFSATQTANELSGRGIGLYVVQKVITDLGGRIELTTNHGYGSTFRMTIPNVFMLRDVLIFDHAGLLYGITRDKLKKIHPFNLNTLHSVSQRNFIQHNNELIEILPLFENDNLTTNDRYLIEIKTESGDSFGIAAKSIEGYQEVIIKSIDHLWGSQKNIAGVAQTDSSNLALIIDTYQLSAEGLKHEEIA